MKKIFYIMTQIFWCFPQNLIGLMLFLIYYQKEFDFFRGAVVIPWNRNCCTSLGCFIFIEESAFRLNHPLLLHEYGHTLQSCILGWFYLPVIFLPSVIWFSFPPLKRFRSRHNFSYYRFYTERWANFLAEKITHEKF